MSKKLPLLVILLSLFFTSCVAVYSNNSLIGKDESFICKKYGTPTYERNAVITKEYKKYEEEPYYPFYFSEDELINGVDIKTLYFEKGIYNIAVYFKYDDKRNWVVFFNLISRKDIRF